MEATIFHCPQCGAVVDQNETQCRYCHALLKTVACPKCLGMMFAGVEFCPHCGVRVKALGQALPASTACPRCSTALKRFDVAGTPLDECSNCGGMWLSVAAFEHVCSNQAAQAAATAMMFPPPQQTKSDVDAVHYLRCPQCSNLMNRMNYAGSGNIVSVCRGHGVWLDCDELRRIIDFLRSGGLERQHAHQEERFQFEKKMAEMDRSLPSPATSYYSPVAGPAYGLDSSLVGMIFKALAHLFS